MLRLARLSLAFVVCQACGGCTLFTNGSHVLLTDPLHFPNNINHLTTHHRQRKIAKQFLYDFSCSNPDLTLSEEYSEGFLDGFADYVTYGPRQAPPTLPPRRYWKKGYATPEGVGAVHDWHAGFADGSFAAAESGLRELQTVPSSYLVSSTEPLLESELLPATTPEPQDTINAPEDTPWRAQLPPEELPLEEMLPADQAPPEEMLPSERMPAEEMLPEDIPPTLTAPQAQTFLEHHEQHWTRQYNPLPMAPDAVRPASHEATIWSDLAEPDR